MPKFTILNTIIPLLLLNCTGKTDKSVKDNDMVITYSTEFQGHRGCRGLMPENTIPGFIKALDLDVDVLEMDVVITADKQVLLSHEPWFSHEICLDPEGNEIAQSEEQQHNIYRMTYEETRRYDCGLKPHPRFPRQEKIAASKPLLEDVIDFSEQHAKATNRRAPKYNIEIKSTPDGDGIFHPEPEEFARLVADVVYSKGIEDRTVIQSFDVRPLQVVRSLHPEMKLALLVENDLSPQKNLEMLGFVPEIYSPYYMLIDTALISFCRRHKMKLITWTVNESDDMKRLQRDLVDGIISDYPDKFPFLYGKQQ